MELSISAEQEREQAPPPWSRAEEPSDAGRSPSLSINSGISFPSSGSHFILHFYSFSDEPQPQSEITPLIEASLSVKTVPCVIGQHTLWRWHCPGLGAKLSLLLALWSSSGKLSWDLSCAAGWHEALCLSENSPQRKHSLYG
ncbi:hypothetical protein OJAV_G00025260 [Oryzias javanicus]|uniref:Uncharacterized protein n=1 Tax=Oryzias javanicus TaxID=123683 RepID=A0A3S2MFG7_ORYJA|nr:hypothetical protein OJAV_G00025260 [Oryzias javanicus]